MILKILAFVFIIAGAIMVFSADYFVKRFKLDKDVKINFENIMDEEELAKYKYTKAVVNFKMLGMLLMLPGLILVIIAFK